MTVTRLTIRRAITFLEAPPAPVALLPAPPQPIALLPAWTEGTLLKMREAFFTFLRLRTLIEARRRAALSPAARKWEDDWDGILDQSERIDLLMDDVRICVKHWEPDVERIDLVGGHYLRKGAHMILLGHPKVQETILAAPGQPDDVHRGEVRAHVLKVKNAPARMVSINEINRANPEAKEALAGL